MKRELRYRLRGDAGDILEPVLRSRDRRPSPHLPLEPIGRPGPFVQGEQRPAAEGPPLERGEHPGPSADEAAGLGSLAPGAPGRDRALGGEPLRDPLHVLLALEAADELGAAIAEDVVIDRARALRAEQARDAVLAPLGEEADQWRLRRRGCNREPRRGRTAGSVVPVRRRAL